MLINLDAPTLLANRMFNQNAGALNNNFIRLATGFAINRGADNPAGLIASENLRATLAALDAESRVIQRSQQVSSVADGALGEISGLLAKADALTVANANTAGLSDAEREANQMELDSIMQSVDRIASTTTFNGDKLLDGSATIRAAGAEFDIGSAQARDIGAVEIEGESFSFADVASGGALNIVDGNVEGAQSAIRQAMSDVAMQRGSLGSFNSNTLGSTLRSIGASFINTAQANSLIRDTNFAFETSSMVRNDILTRSALGALGVLNMNRGQTIGLLGSAFRL